MNETRDDSDIPVSEGLMDRLLITEIERYQSDSDEPDSRLGFFRRLWEIQEDISQDLPPIEPPDEQVLREALLSGQPAFLVTAPEIPVDTFREAVREVTALVSTEETIEEPIRAYLGEADLVGSIDSEMLGSALADVDAFCSAVADATEAPEDARAAVDFVLVSALTSFLTGPASTITDVLGTIDRKIWSSGECPVCGTPASYGRIIDAGQLEGDARVLACPLCRTEWQYDRVRCVRCGSREHSKLRYLFAESDPAHRVHVCDTCQGYLKVTDEREAGRPVAAVVEDAVTLIMDAVAEDRGYHT
jgi:FdhE protein